MTDRNSPDKIEYSDPRLPYQVMRSKGKHVSHVSTYHWNDDVQFDVIVSGEVKYIINGKETIVRANDGMFINAGVLHRIIAKNADYVSVRFNPEALYVTDYIRRTYIDPILSSTFIDCLFLDHSVTWMDSVLEAIRSFYMFHSAQDEDLPLLAISQFFWIWHNLYSYLPKEQAEESTNMQTLRKMIGYIQHNYGNPITLQDIAEAGSLSVSGASLLFRELIQDSPYHFLTEYRLQQSRILLCTSDLSINEITDRCGFPDASHFIRTFRTTYGLTPLQYRKSLKAGITQ